MDYKKYSLENLEKWIEDAINSSEASPQEIYDVIKNVVADNYHCYKNHTEKCYELLALLNGNGEGHISSDDQYKASPWYDYFTHSTKNEVKVCDKDDKSSECQKAWNDFWEENYYPEEHKQHTKKDKVVKWQLPVEVDGLSGECYVNFPDDLMEGANLKEGDTVEWVDNKDGTFTLRHATMSNTIKMDEC